MRRDVVRVAGTALLMFSVAACGADQGPQTRDASHAPPSLKIERARTIRARQTRRSRRIYCESQGNTGGAPAARICWLHCV